jgi:hypothetical protein
MGTAQRSIALALAAAAVAGCLEKEPGKPAGYLGDAAVLPPGADAGTGRHDAQHEVPPVDGAADKWAGQWNFVDGSSGLNCEGAISVTSSAGFMVITPAPSGDVLVVQMNGCSFTFFLDGDTATADPPDQSCPLWAIPNIPHWSLTMQPDGSLQEKLAGQVWLNGQACMISGTSILMHQ